MIDQNFWIILCCNLRICKSFEISITIYSNSERSNQYWNRIFFDCDYFFSSVNPQFPFSLWTFISMFILEFQSHFLIGISFSFFNWNYLQFLIGLLLFIWNYFNLFPLVYNWFLSTFFIGFYLILSYYWRFLHSH